MNPVEGIKLTIAKRIAQIEKKKLQEFLNRLDMYQRKEYVDHITKLDSIFDVGVILSKDVKKIKKLEKIETQKLTELVQKYDPLVRDCLILQKDANWKTVQTDELINRALLHYEFYRGSSTHQLSVPQIMAPFVALLNTLKKLVEKELTRIDQEISKLSERLKAGGW